MMHGSILIRIVSNFLDESAIEPLGVSQFVGGDCVAVKFLHAIRAMPPFGLKPRPASSALAVEHQSF